MNEQVIPGGAQIVQPQPSVDYNIFIQENTTLTKKFDMFLMGQEEILDENRNKILIQTSKPKTNTEGRKAMMSWVTIYINPNTYLAENKEHNVQNIYKLDQINIATELFTNLNEFELTIEDACSIHSKICELIMHALMRSMTDKKYIFPQISTSYAPNVQQPEKPKLFGIF